MTFSVNRWGLETLGKRSTCLASHCEWSGPSGIDAASQQEATLPPQRCNRAEDGALTLSTFQFASLPYDPSTSFI